MYKLADPLILQTLADPYWRLYNLYRIMVKGDEGEQDMVVDFAPNRAQTELLDSLHGRDLVLKARQLGFTTLSAILWLDTALFTANMRCGIIAQDQGAAEVIFRDKVRYGYEHIGDRLGLSPSGESWNEVLKRAMPLARDSASELLFDHNNSSIRVATSMRSGTIHRLHVCLSGDTEVLLKDGHTKRMDEVQPDDLVMTGNGSYQPVLEVIKNRIEDVGHPLLRIEAFGYYGPLKATANHEILTRERATGKPVWKPAGELESGDYMAMPVREPSMKLRDGRLPFDPPKQVRVNGKRVKDSGRRIEVDFNLGVVVGMYLAEGHIRRSETTFALHRGEEVEWMLALLSNFSSYFESVRVYDHKDSLTTQVTVNGREFAEFLIRFFGAGADKCIPDAVWGYGRDFLDGLVWGYFQGDGCFECHTTIQITSIRRQLIDQIRMLLMSLRFGVPTVYRRAAGVYYGRNCKECWVLKLNGAGNWKFREHFGLTLPAVNTKAGQWRLANGRRPEGRKNWRRGAAHYWMRVTSVELAPDEEFVYDLALPDYPHSYATVHGIVHNSEYGKICAKYPDKAREVITGSIPAVPLDGIVIIESTAEGQDGDFYKKVQRAMAAQQEGRELSRKDFRLHFFPWWAEPGYCMPDDAIPLVPITEKDRKYFTALEAKIGRELSDGQKAWYVATRESDFSGEDEKMWQEYPGTPEEAFQVSTEGVYYAEQLANARKGGRICRVPYVDVPVNTFWDVGRSDSTAIWFHQQVGPEHRFIRYHEDSGQTLGTYMKYLQDTGYVFGKHYLPHDAAHKRLSTSNKSIEEMLVDLGIPSSDVIIVDRISDEQVGIQQTRKAFPSCWFDEVGCAQGLQRLGGFKRAWNKTTGAWRNEPAENGCEHGADAFRQFGQALDTGQYRGPSGNSGAQKIKRRGSGMAV